VLQYSATGKLGTRSVKEIKANWGGCARNYRSRWLKKGELLVTFDPTAPEVDLESLTKLQEPIVKGKSILHNSS